MYQCVCVCACDTWYSLHVMFPYFFSFFISHCACHFFGLSNGQRSPGTAMGNGLRDFVELDQVWKWQNVGVLLLLLFLLLLVLLYIYIHFIFHNAVDGRNEEILYPVDMPTIPQIRGFYVSQLVQDLFHEVYFDGLFFWYVGDNLLLSSMTRLYALVTSCDKWLV